MIVSLTGPSGTGKTSVARRLLTTFGNRFQGNGFLIPSFTTRPRRFTDITGEYRYVDVKTFHAMYNEGVFEWTAEYGGSRYGTRTADLLEACSPHTPWRYWVTVLVPGRIQLLVDFLAEHRTELLPFFFVPPAENVIRARLVQRGDCTPTQIDQRVEESREWELDARHSGIPYLLVPDMPDLAQKYAFVEETLRARRHAA